MIEPRSVVHFSIAVSDLDASHKFYTEILGLTLVQAAPANGMVFLRAGNDHVILAKSDAPLQRDAKDSRRAHHAFKVDPERYEDAKTFLASKGVEVFEEEDRKKGVFVGRQFYIHDPNGYGVELLYELPREVWEGDIDAALNYSDRLPTEGPEALQDRTDVPVFGAAK